MKHKALKIFGGVVVAGIFLYCVFLAMQQSLDTVSSRLGIPTGSGMVRVKDFTAHPVQQVQDTQLIERTDQFSIMYYPKEQAFNITVTGSQIRQARAAAESEFLRMLDIDKNQACQLRVSLMVPYAVAPDLAGRNYALSFCKSGVLF